MIRHLISTNGKWCLFHLAGYFGLTRMDDFEGTPPVVHNRCLSITLGYKFKL